MAFWKGWLLIWITCFLSRSLITAAPCFITNCPPGGKRSYLSPGRQPEVTSASKMNPISHTSANGRLSPVRTSPCLACGPDGGGRCLGPHLCCGPSIGCYFKTKETEICSWSPLMSPTACDPLFHGQRRKTCHVAGADADEDVASCVANGICCSSGRCQVDPTCRTDHFDYDRSWNILTAPTGDKIK